MEFDKKILIDCALEAADKTKEVKQPKINNNNSLMPYYIKQILVSATNYKKPLSIEKIAERLDQYPYCICADHKSISRNINALMSFYSCINRDARGAFYDDRKKAA